MKIFIKSKASVVLGAFGVHVFQMIPKESRSSFQLFTSSLLKETFGVLSNTRCFVEASFLILEHFCFFLLYEFLPQTHFLNKRGGTSSGNFSRYAYSSSWMIDDSFFLRSNLFKISFLSVNGCT
jgi:hypothetical protein